MAVSTLSALLVSAIAVRGATSCPTPADVTDALAALLPAASASNDVAELVADRDAIRVRLVDAGGGVLAEKRLPPGNCRQMAETAAVVLAAWESELRPDVTLGFALPPRAPAVAPPSPAATVSASPPASRPAPTWVVSAGATVLASLDGNSVAPGGTVEGRLLGRRSGGGARLALTAIGTHRLDVGPGQAAWRRTTAAIGVVRRIASPRVFAEADLDLLAGLLAVDGQGFTVAGSDRSVDAGGALGARAGLRLGRFEPYVGGAAAAWLRPQTVEVSGIQGRQHLPRVEAHVGVGVSVVWDP